MVQVVLLERIEKLGQIGDVVNVKPGYARNFLFPREKALRATQDNIARFEAEKAQIMAENLKQKQEAEKVAGKMAGLEVVVIRQAGESGHLYGSVTSKDIADAVTAAGFTITKDQVQIARPIKELGLISTRLALHPEVRLNITVNVAQSEEEAKLQVEKAKAAAEAPQVEDRPKKAKKAAKTEDTEEVAATEDASEEMASSE